MRFFESKTAGTASVSLWALAMALYLTVGAAAADGQSYFDYAKVIRVDPIREAVAVPVMKERCHSSRGAERADEAIAGDVRTENFGISIGEAIGQEIEHRERTIDLRRCRLITAYEERRRITAYRVSYAYGGDVFVRRMSEHPGERIRVRVTVDPP